MKRIFTVIIALLCVSVSDAQGYSIGDTVNVTPKVHVDDKFDYSYLRITTVDEKTDTLSRNLTLTVSDINDTTIVMKMVCHSSKNTKMDDSASFDPMTDIMKCCVGKLTAREYDVAVDKNTGKYIGIYGNAWIGHTTANELMDSIVCLYKQIAPLDTIKESDLSQLRSALSYTFCPESVFEELAYIFSLAYQPVVVGEDNDENISTKVEVTDGCVSYSLTSASDEKNRVLEKLTLGRDNMLISFHLLEDDVQVIIDPDGKEMSLKTNNLTIIERK